MINKLPKILPPDDWSSDEPIDWETRLLKTENLEGDLAKYHKK